MSQLSDFWFNLKDNKTFLCGIFFVAYTFGLFTFYSPYTFYFALTYTLIVIFLLIFLGFKNSPFRLFSPLFIFALYLIFIAGYLNAKNRCVLTDDFSKILNAKNVEITGTIEEIPKINSRTGTYKFSFKPMKFVFKNIEYDVDSSLLLVVLRDYKGTKKLKYKDIYNFKGTISSPVYAQNPSQFDYKSFLQRKGILKTFYVNENEYSYVDSPSLSDIKSKKKIADKIQVLNVCFLRFMDDLRDNVLQEHSKYIKSPRLEVLGGVVFGDDAVNPPDDIKESFINSGLLHLLAASGLNVAIILSMWFCLVYFVNLPYRLKISSGMFVVFLYTIMTGFPPSIVRASVMLMIILFGKFIYRETNGVSLIFIAGILILLFKPQLVLDVGFQLSFLVTFGLIVCTPTFSTLLFGKEKSYLKKIKAFPNLIKSFLIIFSPAVLCCSIAIPFISQLWAAPLQAYYFNTFSLYSVFANLAVIPFIEIVSFLGFMSTAFCFLPKVSKFILPVSDSILNLVIQIILKISAFFSSLPHSSIKVPSPSIYGIITFYLLVILFFLSLKHLFKRKALNISLLIAFCLFLLSFIQIKEESAEVIFFSVGNADNCLIKTKNDKYIMIDTGRYIFKDSSSAKMVTLEYFYDKNIRNIDTLVLTHYDSDHSGGLIDILKEVKVKNLVIPKLECSSQNSCAIKKYISENNIKYIAPKHGQTFVFDKDTKLINFLPHTSNLRSRNDFSTISLFIAGDYKFLFMADAGIEAYNSVKDSLNYDIDVLKAAHHGAKHTVTDEMLNGLKPEYSILSTGRNRYGHPNKETVEILSKHSKVLSTKDLGAIKFKIKDDMKVFHFNSKKKKFEEIF